MSKHNGRLLLVVVLGVLAAALAPTGVRADLTLSCTPSNATANSVWNWTAIWQDDEGRWPVGALGDIISEGGVDRTRGKIRPDVGAEELIDGFDAGDAGTLDNDTVFYRLNAPTFDGFVTEAGSPSYERYFPDSYVTGQPDPASLIRNQSGMDDRRRYWRGLDYTNMEVVDVPNPLPDLPADPTPGIYKQVIQDNQTTVTRIIIIPARDPVWLTNVYLDANATSTTPATLAPANTIVDTWPADRNVIILTKGVPYGYTRLYVSYYYPGRTYVATPLVADESNTKARLAGFPLPLPYTVYTFAVPTASPRIKINQEILNLTGKYAAAYAADPMLQSATSPLLGIFENDDLSGTNFFSYWDTGYTTLYLTKALPDLATEGWIDCDASMIGTVGQNLSAVTPTNSAIIGGVQGVYTNPGFTGTNYYVPASANPQFKTGDATIVLTTPVPAGTNTVWIRYNAQKGTPNQDKTTLVPGDPNGITRIRGVYTTSSLAQAPLEADRLNYLLPFEPAGGDHTTYAWINLPVGKAITGEALYLKVDSFAVEGVYDDPVGRATNYFYKNGVRGVYDAKQGIIKLAQPLKQDGAVVWLDYRPLSRKTLTVGRPVLSRVRRLKAEAYYSTDAVDFDATSTDISYAATFGRHNGRFTVTTDNSDLPGGTYCATIGFTLEDTESTSTGVVWLHNDVGATIPMYYIDGVPQTGARYKVSTSAGLNMSNPKQQPSGIRAEDRLINNNKLIYDPFGHPMWYSPGLRGAGDPRTREVHATCYVPGIDPPPHAQTTVTVRSSRAYTPGDMIDYGGGGTRDWLLCYPQTGGASWPAGYDVDPLSIEPIEESNPEAPDDGSSSTQFVFRVHYHNEDAAPPLPWSYYYDEWGGPGPSGVVLYLDEQGTGDYKPHYMYPEVPLARDAPFPKDLNYIYRVIPHHDIVSIADPLSYPWHWSVDSYQSLAIGVYHYFFGCSDDSLTFDEDGSFVLEHNILSEYGANMYDSPTTDPYLPRQVAGYPEINRPGKRRYSADNLKMFDHTIHVDRYVRIPGLFEQGLELGLGFSYPWKAEQHPVVTCELGMGKEYNPYQGIYWTDDLGVMYDDPKYGNGRFYGTIDPFYRASNPELPGSHTTSDLALLAETCGATTKTNNVFRILYKQKDNKPPIYIRVWINNASEMSPKDAAHKYTAFSMAPRSDQTQPYDYRTGVWYEYKTKLPAGPHTYYFEAYDGEHVCRYPVRPDRYPYDYAGEPGALGEWWVPTSSLAADRGKPDYFDNDYFPGPFVNHPCVVSETSVTPGTGKEGQTFKYRAKYSDPDGQRVYSAYIYIEVNDRGDIRKFQMQPEAPFTDPENDHSQDYKNGVYYVLDTATIKDFALEKGVRRYYFEFTDDWGRQHDPNDIIKGETTRFPEGDGNWVSGPVISGNYAPTLANGSVESQDGTANAATLWTFRVTYRDLNNDAPAMIKVFLGLLQPDGRTIVWDDGHTMLQDDTSDKIYSDGASYYYQTRLGAVDTVEQGQQKPEPKQYFYAFEAYDGIDWATFKSSSLDEVRSNAAGCMILHDLTKMDDTHYRFSPTIVQRGTVTGALELKPDNPGDIVNVLGVYKTEDLSEAAQAADRTSYFKPFTAGDTSVYTSTLPSGTTSVWVKSWKRQTGSVVARDTVSPGNAADITVRLLGVYLDQYLLGRNYYDPAKASPAFTPGQTTIKLTTSLPDGVTQVYVLYETLEQATATTAQTVALASPANIVKVTGVYLNAGMTGTNYHRDFASGDSTILLTDPATVGSNLWIHYEAISPIVGPLPVELPEPPGIIPDARLFQDYSSNPIPILLDEQKNGWVSPLDPNDRGVIWMKGTAQHEGNPSLGYVVPDSPSAIASVEGVYLTSALDRDPTPDDATDDWQYLNYYDPQVFDPPAKQLAVFNSAGVGIGSVTPSDPSRILAVLGVYDNPDLTGKNYYRGGSLLWQEATVTDLTQVLPSRPQDIVSIAGVYVALDSTGANYYDPVAHPYRRPDVSREPAFNSELVTLSKPLPTTPTPYRKVYIRYYGPGTLDYYGRVPLAENPPSGTSQMYVHYRAPSYNCGDTSIRLTTDLPASEATGTVTAPLQVTPADASIIGEVLGVYRSQAESADPSKNLYAASENPFRLGDSYIRLKNNLADPPAVGTTGLYISYIPKNRTVYVKYSSLQFTHQLRGEASQVISYYAGPQSPYTLVTAVGTTHWTPDGYAGASIKGNAQGATIDTFSHIADPFGRLIDSELFNNGVIGLWLDAQRTRVNYINPAWTTRNSDTWWPIRLYQDAPVGTNFLYGRYYQYGQYHIDRWKRAIIMRDKGSPYGRLQASYFFGAKMPQTLGPNTAPELSEGKISRQRGSRNDRYEYTVVYKDLDGPNGQAPTYIKVYIDGVPYNMTPIVSGTPAFREGAVYTYTPPDGLTGGSHKFHFEASDGAAVAWFDANGAHQSLVGAAVPVTAVIDIDGPWVNNPPELLNGIATPNPNADDDPATAAINPWDSVDYTVTYQDADNDEPYFYDPIRDVLDYDSNKNGIMDGPEWSGSPRLWIDSDKVDQYFTGTVEALEDDVMSQGKKRTIVAAGSPGWTVGAFDGALMQITNGPLAGRVYLIERNTANKIVVATEDLSKDGVVAGGANASTFRVNGLLMSKADATQQDFTKGVTYKVTVPKLAVGNHSFHFTAHSREYKPQWLVNKLAENDRVPYSGEVRFPTTGDSDGPTVISKPPQGNAAPVVSLTAESQREDPKDPLFAGPAAQIALATTANEVQAFYPTLFAQIREVRGVFLNANDIDLTSLVNTDELAKSKYDPKTATTAFMPGDKKIVLTSPFAAVAEGTELVQFGNVDSSSLLTVTPDANKVITDVTGVFLTTDPTLAGTNYYKSADGATSGTFDGSKVNLGQPLPSGTKRVYIRYTYKAVTAGALWPAPVYVKCFTRTSSRTFKSTDLVTFRANYRDADDDPPSYHDSVQGYVKLVFNTSGQGSQMQLLNLPSAGQVINYKLDQAFSTEPMTLPEGTHKYHIEASDGYDPDHMVRFPSGSLGDPAANDYTVTVNYRPVIAAGKVDPAIGQTATTFTFTATYKDQDGTAAKPPTVSVRITKLDAAYEETHDMTATSSNPNYAAGVDYVYSTKSLQPGTYKVVFEASDGDGEDAAPYPAPSQPQILFSVRDTNEVPEIISISVIPEAGGFNKLFSYKAQYRDKDGDAPIGKTDGAKDAMTLIIDPGTSSEQTLRMTKAAGEPATPDYWNDGKGVAYQTTQSISGKKLGAGNHTYTVEASDGTADTGLLMTGQVDTSDSLLKTVIPGSPNVIGSVVGVFRQRDLRGGVNYFVSADGATRGQFIGGKIKLARSLPSGTRSVYVQYALRGPILLIPYFENFKAVDATLDTPELRPALTQAVVGQEVLFVADMRFPANTVTNPPTQINNITIQITKPDGTSLSLSGSVSSYQEEFETLPDGTKRRTGWVGRVLASYPKGVDPALVTGTSLTLTASGEWTIGMSWPGDSSWDAADTTGKEIKIAVGGQMRTVAVADPTRPDTSTPLIDMITVPKILGSADVGRVFGYERALDMQIVRWDAGSRTYFRYGLQGAFPDLKPGDAIWIKPKSSYPAESSAQSLVDSGLLALGNPESPFSPSAKYRLLKAFVKDYPKNAITGETEPCAITLKPGWNQFGSIFFNWKRNASGTEITPKIDVGIPITELSVRYLNETKTLEEAAAAGWVRGYAWRWDAPSKQYVMVHSSATGAERVVKAWCGYWIRAFVDCELVVPAVSSYNGQALAAASAPRSVETATVAGEPIEAPPPAPE